MPYLIDGNNLDFALRGAGYDHGRTGLCALLGALAKDDKVAVVFDGARPPHGLQMQMEHRGLSIEFSAPQSADALILRHIATSSAPRLLTVVSSDREIRDAARRRQCQTIRSEDFVPGLLEVLLPPRPPKPGEPPQKREGLSPEESQRWMHEFNLDEESGEDDSQKPNEDK